MAALRLEISDELKADLQTYARKYGISVAAAVRILLHQALANERIDSRRAAAGLG
jgi:antitoxin component of RelBE/YafQ-DinJ toxin-antitoxin module